MDLKCSKGNETDLIYITGQDLQRGVIVACTKNLTNTSTELDMYLQLGLDFDYNLTCIVFATRFRLLDWKHSPNFAPISLAWNFCRLLFSYIRHRLGSRRALIFYDSLWKPLCYSNLICVDLCSSIVARKHPTMNMSLRSYAYVDMPRSMVLKQALSSVTGISASLPVRPWNCFTTVITISPATDFSYSICIVDSSKHGTSLSRHSLCLICVFSSLTARGAARYFAITSAFASLSVMVVPEHVLAIIGKVIELSSLVWRTGTLCGFVEALMGLLCFSLIDAFNVFLDVHGGCQDMLLPYVLFVCSFMYSGLLNNCMITLLLVLIVKYGREDRAL